MSFFYLLTRGTPGVDGMGWGSVKEVLREACKGDGASVYTSKGGEMLAREMASELLTGERPTTAQPLAPQLDVLTMRHNALANDIARACEDVGDLATAMGEIQDMLTEAGDTLASASSMLDEIERSRG